MSNHISIGTASNIAIQQGSDGAVQSFQANDAALQIVMNLLEKLQPSLDESVPQRELVREIDLLRESQSVPTQDTSFVRSTLLKIRSKLEEFASTAVVQGTVAIANSALIAIREYLKD